MRSAFDLPIAAASLQIARGALWRAVEARDPPTPTARCGSRAPPSTAQEKHRSAQEKHRSGAGSVHRGRAHGGGVGARRDLRHLQGGPPPRGGR
uniref:Uncharacterized protein n=1 Tax=Zea mays TaxID=4577 RepID=A0A804N3U9_MAIZE